VDDHRPGFVLGGRNWVLRASASGFNKSYSVVLYRVSWCVCRGVTRSRTSVESGVIQSRLLSAGCSARRITPAPECGDDGPNGPRLFPAGRARLRVPRVDVAAGPPGYHHAPHQAGSPILAARPEVRPAAAKSPGRRSRPSLRARPAVRKLRPDVTAGPSRDRRVFSQRGEGVGGVSVWAQSVGLAGVGVIVWSAGRYFQRPAFGLANWISKNSCLALFRPRPKECKQ